VVRTDCDACGKPIDSDDYLEVSFKIGVTEVFYGQCCKRCAPSQEKLGRGRMHGPPSAAARTLVNRIVTLRLDATETIG
jgi:hypothetical protein